MTRSDQSFGIIAVRRAPSAADHPGDTPAPTPGYEFLLVKHGAGHWGFPKGHPNPGETPLQTARRELQEETGINHCRIKDGIQFHEKYSFEHHGEQVVKSVTYFPAIVAPHHAAAAVAQAEIRDCRWADLRSAQQLLTFPEAQTLLSEVCEWLDEQ